MTSLLFTSGFGQTLGKVFFDGFWRLFSCSTAASIERFAGHTSYPTPTTVTALRAYQKIFRSEIRRSFRFSSGPLCDRFGSLRVKH